MSNTKEQTGCATDAAKGSKLERYISNVVGPVILRGYVERDGKIREFVVTDGAWAWVDYQEDFDEVSRIPYSPETWNDFRLVPLYHAMESNEAEGRN